MTEPSIQDKSTEYSSWFGEIIHQIKTHQLQLETNTASKEIEDFYESLFKGDEIKVLNKTREQSTQYFVKKIVELYIQELRSRKLKINKLALSTSDERVLVWVEIPDDDFESEKQLILAQSVANSAFHEYGFHIESMIVEETDELDVPAQYFSIIE